MKRAFTVMAASDIPSETVKMTPPRKRLQQEQGLHALLRIAGHGEKAPEALESFGEDRL